MEYTRFVIVGFILSVLVMEYLPVAVRNRLNDGLLYFVLNLADMGITLIGFSLGASEGNPLLSTLLAGAASSAVIYRMGIAVILYILVVMLRKHMLAFLNFYAIILLFSNLGIVFILQK